MNKRFSALLPKLTGSISAGKFQVVVDACIVTASLFVVSLPMLVGSVVSATILNLIMVMNQLPGRYAV